jgi:small conductance mechanosensitive channel
MLDAAKKRKKIMGQQFTEALMAMWDKMEGWLKSIIVNLPNFVIAIIVFTIAYYVAKQVRKYTIELTKRVIQQASVRSLVANIAAGVVLVIGFLLALNVLNLDEVLKSILAGAGIVGLAVGLALQGALANTFSGVYLAVKDVIGIGDWIETNGYSGSVEEITLRNTKVKEADNNIVIIPNKDVLDKPFKNYGLTKRLRITLKCGVSYDSDLEEVREIGKTAIAEIYPSTGSENIEFHYLEFGGSSIDFQLRFWVDAKYKLTVLEAKSKAVIALKKAFDKHNIDIPFPIRTVYNNYPDSPLRIESKGGLMKSKSSNGQRKKQSSPSDN